MNATAATVEEAVARLKEVEASTKEFHEKIFNEGRLVHRSEPELKTHTSYLVFAVLPREWTEEDEEACTERWPPRVDMGTKDASKSRRQMKREAKRRAEEREASNNNSVAGVRAG